LGEGVGRRLELLAEFDDITAAVVSPIERRPPKACAVNPLSRADCAPRAA